MVTGRATGQISVFLVSGLTGAVFLVNGLIALTFLRDHPPLVHKHPRAVFLVNGLTALTFLRDLPPLAHKHPPEMPIAKTNSRTGLARGLPLQAKTIGHGQSTVNQLFTSTET